MQFSSRLIAMIRSSGFNRLPLLSGVKSQLGLRCYSSSVHSLFQLFPNTFSQGGPPKDPFLIPTRSLRREFRSLQSEHHPDILGASGNASDNFSSILNKAYSTISNPYTRVCHVIELHHPEHIDITQDEVSKHLIAKFQSDSDANSLEYKDMLMVVLEAHEALEFANDEGELEPLEEENQGRIDSCEEVIDSLLKQQSLDWDKIMLEAIRLKYWVNIQNAIKEWEPGKPVHLTH